MRPNHKASSTVPRKLLLYEHRSEPLLSRHAFARRVFRHLAFALGIIGVSLGIGVVGYRWSEGMGWLDATLNAAMILGGMGPVTTLQTDGGKLFATIYALFSGVVFLVAVGVFVAPIVHRFMHRFHLDLDASDSKD